MADQAQWQFTRQFLFDRREEVREVIDDTEVLMMRKPDGSLRIQRMNLRFTVDWLTALLVNVDEYMAENGLNE